MRLGIPEQDEYVIPEMPGDESFMATGRLCDAVLKPADRLVPVFEIHAMGSRRHVDQFAKERGDLAPFRLHMLDRRRFPRGGDRRGHLCDGIFRARDDRR